MASPPEYLMRRDYAESNRIHLQHYLWIQLFQYHIHPKIPIDPNARIADIGTSTGIWLTDLASLLPDTVQLDGLDISFETTPHPGCLPPNMTLWYFDIKKPVPQELLGVYDIIHVRQFAFVLCDNEVPEALERLTQMLKPGGYIQWAEPDLNSFRIEKVNPDIEVYALAEMSKVNRGLDKRLDPKWVSDVASLLKAGGLEDVDSDIRDSPAHLSMWLQRCNLLLPASIAGVLKNEKAVSQHEKLIPIALKEIQAGAFWAWTRETAIGRKPRTA